MSVRSTDGPLVALWHKPDQFSETYFSPFTWHTKYLTPKSLRLATNCYMVRSLIPIRPLWGRNWASWEYGCGRFPVSRTRLTRLYRPWMPPGNAPRLY